MAPSAWGAEVSEASQEVWYACGGYWGAREGELGVKGLEQFFPIAWKIALFASERGFEGS